MNITYIPYEITGKSLACPNVCALLLESFGKVMLTLLTCSEGESGRRYCFLPGDVIFSFCGHNYLFLSVCRFFICRVFWFPLEIVFLTTPLDAHIPTHFSRVSAVSYHCFTDDNTWI